MPSLNPANLVKSVNLYPSGEYGYSIEPIIQGDIVLNAHHSDKSKTDIILSLEQLKQTLPNLEYINVILHWFSTSTNIAKARIIPKVEFSDNDLPWNVAGYTRKSAEEVLRNDDGKLNYGGTPTDKSILDLCQWLKVQGYKVMFSPIIMVDDTDKSWRGFMRPEVQRVDKVSNIIDDFFNDRQTGYNKFILHYAELLKDSVDIFSIGNELKLLTYAQNQYLQFPAVKQLVNLAVQTKEIMGADVKLTYMANWGEYHHVDGGIYHLDPLWSNDNLDLVAMSASYPLTDDLSQSQITCREIKEGWKGKEGWEYYKSGVEKVNFDDPTWAWKNFQHWWGSEHISNEYQTDWTPKMKPFIIEYGFASISEISNGPSKFYTCSSPQTDYQAQSLAIAASELYFVELNSEEPDLVPQRFLSHWDSRPFPYYPGFSHVWTDCSQWEKNPVLNGKIGNFTVDVTGCLNSNEYDL
jgi:hypothetical protein